MAPIPLSRILQLLHVAVLLVLPAFLILKFFEVTEEALSTAKQLIRMKQPDVAAGVVPSTGERNALADIWTQYYDDLKPAYRALYPTAQEIKDPSLLTSDRRSQLLVDARSVSHKHFRLMTRTKEKFGRRLDDPSFWVVFACAVACWLVSRAARRLDIACACLATQPPPLLPASVPPHSDPLAELLKEPLSKLLVPWHFARLCTTWHVIACWPSGCKRPSHHTYWAFIRKSLARLKDRLNQLAPALPTAHVPEPLQSGSAIP